MFVILDNVLVLSKQVVQLVRMALDLDWLAFESLKMGDLFVSWYPFKFIEIQGNEAIVFAGIWVIGFLLLDHLVSKLVVSELKTLESVVGGNGGDHLPLWEGNSVEAWL